MLRAQRAASSITCPTFETPCACRVSMIMNSGYHHPTGRRGLEKQDWTVTAVRIRFRSILHIPTRFAVDFDGHIRKCSIARGLAAPAFATNGGARSLPAGSPRTSSGSQIRTGSTTLHTALPPSRSTPAPCVHPRFGVACRHTFSVAPRIRLSACRQGA
jgi:hypothetical protein